MFHFFATKRVTFSVAGLVWALLLASPIAQGNAPEYSELKYSLKRDLVTRINRDRAAHGVGPVQLDPHASDIADRYCELQIRERTSGHFSTDGYAPYMRYSLAGGNDGLSQNAAAWSANYTFSESVIPDLISRSQDVMLAEKPPHDGHRRTILDADATHVGIGLAWEKGEFRMTQEFLRRYVEWTQPPQRLATVGDRVSLTARPLPGYKVVAASVHHEDFPQPMSAVVANKIENYGLPKSRRDFLPRRHSSTRSRLTRLVDETGGSPGDLIVRKDGSFTFAVPFDRGTGMYTIVVWVRKEGTERSIPASNITIRVDRSAGGYGAGIALGSR